MSLFTTAAVLLSVPPTALLSGIFGMSGGMILMGVFTWLLPVAVAMILHGITQAGSNGYRAYLHRRHIYWPVLRGYVFGSAISVALFSWVAYVPSAAGGVPHPGVAAVYSLAVSQSCRRGDHPARCIGSPVGYSSPPFNSWPGCRGRCWTFSI